MPPTTRSKTRDCDTNSTRIKSMKLRVQYAKVMLQELNALGTKDTQAWVEERFDRYKRELERAKRLKNVARRAACEASNGGVVDLVFQSASEGDQLANVLTEKVTQLQLMRSMAAKNVQKVEDKIKVWKAIIASLELEMGLMTDKGVEGP